MILNDKMNKEVIEIIKIGVMETIRMRMFVIV
jgi:hypothetical protein